MQTLSLSNGKRPSRAVLVLVTGLTEHFKWFNIFPVQKKEEEMRSFLVLVAVLVAACLFSGCGGVGWSVTPYAGVYGNTGDDYDGGVGWQGGISVTFSNGRPAPPAVIQPRPVYRNEVNVNNDVSSSSSSSASSNSTSSATQSQTQNQEQSQHQSQRQNQSQSGGGGGGDDGDGCGHPSHGHGHGHGHDHDPPGHDDDHDD